MFTTVYVYNRDTGVLIYEDSGYFEDVVSSVARHNDYTLTPPPEINDAYKWNGKEWVKVETN